MIIKKCNGLRGFLIPASVSVWVSCVSGANAWQQEYIAIDTKSNTAERYTWDSDHQPRYEDILAERLKSSETPGGLALNQGLAPPDSGRGLSVGWNYPLANGVTSGPVASLRSDVTAPTVRSAGEAGYVNTLGWRTGHRRPDIAGERLVIAHLRPGMHAPQRLIIHAPAERVNVARLACAATSPRRR